MAKAFRPCTHLLRFLAMAATIAATSIMATCHETTTFFGVTIKAEFYQSPSFTFFVVANAIAGAYSLLALFVPPGGLISRWVVVLDVITAMLLTAAMAAAAAISHVGKKGNEHAGWLPICDEVPKYCNQVMGALISGAIGLLLYTIIVIHTITNAVNPLFP
ncbi:CASP-like protein 1C1 [Phalaenopsis equestris]|uniref:CASP-like protein 1C1 n=1 Tax=Phalaenopsis equestris TaxID=78828 RepID=UPI0009E2F598|nr:CASP-like protein 1C1 [Phalaenopsis equestris]